MHASNQHHTTSATRPAHGLTGHTRRPARATHRKATTEQRRVKGAHHDHHHRTTIDPHRMDQPNRLTGTHNPTRLGRTRDQGSTPPSGRQATRARYHRRHHRRHHTHRPAHTRDHRPRRRPLDESAHHTRHNPTPTPHRATPMRTRNDRPRVPRLPSVTRHTHKGRRRESPGSSSQPRTPCLKPPQRARSETYGPYSGPTTPTGQTDSSQRYAPKRSATTTAHASPTTQ